MKLLFTIPIFSRSGASKMMVWVANQMAEQGHDVHFVTFFSEEKVQDIHKDIELHSLKVVQSKKRLVRNTTGMLKTISRLHKTVRQIKPDIVVSFLDSVGYVYLPIGRLFTKCKFIVSERVDPYSYCGWNAKIRFRLMRFAHGTVFQTEGARTFFKKYKKIYKHSTVIPNPVVVSDKILFMQKHIPTYEERDNRIVTVGRLSLKQKRQDVLLKAFENFHETHPEYKLVIYGDGQDRAKIQSMIDDMNLSEQVVLAGRTDKVEENIFKASAFVLTSDYEGVPNALIEAMSIGVPCVSTDCSPGGAALLIQNGENGFLVPCGDTVAIVEAVSNVVDQKTISELFSRSGVYITQAFSERIIASKWEHFFKQYTQGSYN